MRVDIKAPGADLDTADRDAVERAFLMALGRFWPRVSQVVLTVEPAAADRTQGGPTWQLVAQVGGVRRFLVIEVDRDLGAAAGRAADRARRCIERDLSVQGWRPVRDAGRRRAGTLGARLRAGGGDTGVAADAAGMRGRR